MKKSLYKIESEYLTIINEVEELEGVLTPELEDALKINESELQTKSIAYKEVIDSSTSFISRIDAEIKMLTALKKRHMSIVSRLKENLLNAVNLFGSFEVEFTKFGTRKSQSVQVENINALPAIYKSIKVLESADKAKIKEAIKSGIEIEGAELVDNLSLKIN